MDSYSLPRRIWRIIYPVLIFFGIQVVVGLFGGIILAFYFIFTSIISGAAQFDVAMLLDNVTRYITSNIIVVVLITNVASFAVFLPIWLSTRKRLEPYENKLTVVVGILVFGFFAGYNIIQMVIFGVLDVERFFPSYSEIEDVVTSGSLAMQILSVGLAAPVVEELVFRGILMNRMKWLPAWASVLIQAMIFGAIHMNWFQSLYAFLAGILLGLVYMKYRSITIAITGHIAFNMASVVLGEFLTEDNALVVLIICPVVMVACGTLLIARPGARKKAAALPDNVPAPWQLPERADPY